MDSLILKFLILGAGVLALLFVWYLVRSILRQSPGNSKMQAAELLKVSFRSLRYKVKKYEL